MTGETWLFLFAAIGALGGLATMADVSLKLSDRLLGGVTMRKQITETASRRGGKAIQITRTRFAVVTVLLLTSGALSIGGLVSGIRREEPLKPPLRQENLEGTLRQWLDSFGLSTKKIDSPDTLFAIVVTLENGNPVGIGQPKKLDHFITLQTVVVPGDKTAVDKLSPAERGELIDEIRLELLRAKVGYTFDQPDQLNQITLTRPIPITNALTEGVLLQNIEDMDIAVSLTKAAIVLGLKKRAQTTTK